MDDQTGRDRVKGSVATGPESRYPEGHRLRTENAAAPAATMLCSGVLPPASSRSLPVVGHLGEVLLITYPPTLCVWCQSFTSRRCWSLFRF